uniref:(northern house mosquito) hypothetical protein n=1 Tax=Culex pipiens TaxID=7175 RepID=A0A8D8CIV7_CULPI
MRVCLVHSVQRRSGGGADFGTSGPTPPKVLNFRRGELRNSGGLRIGGGPIASRMVLREACSRRCSSRMASMKRSFRVGWDSSIVMTLSCEGGLTISTPLASRMPCSSAGVSKARILLLVSFFWLDGSCLTRTTFVSRLRSFSASEK